MKEVLQKLLANWMLWLIFVLVYVAYYVVKHDLSPTEIIPRSVFEQFLPYDILIFQLVAAALLFTLFSFVTHKSKNENDISRGKKFMDISLAEFSGILFNFGSISFAIAFMAQNWVVAIGTVVSYIIGILVHPK